MTNRSVLNNEAPPYYELGHLHQNFRDWEPDEVFQMATRVWCNVIINGAVYELQTTFFLLKCLILIMSWSLGL